MKVFRIQKNARKHDIKVLTDRLIETKEDLQKLNEEMKDILLGGYSDSGSLAEMKMEDLIETQMTYLISYRALVLTVNWIRAIGEQARWDAYNELVAAGLHLTVLNWINDPSEENYEALLR